MFWFLLLFEQYIYISHHGRHAPFSPPVRAVLDTTPAISKIIEWILYDQLYNYLTKFELLSDSHQPLMISPAFDDKHTDNSLFLEIQFWMVGAVINILIKLRNIPVSGIIFVVIGKVYHNTILSLQSLF